MPIETIKISNVTWKKKRRKIKKKGKKEKASTKTMTTTQYKRFRPICKFWLNLSMNWYSVDDRENPSITNCSSNKISSNWDSNSCTFLRLILDKILS
jgi:hypothetical protein